ncbi:MAG: N-formylglutamate amidohydrolase [Spirochaetes bacterium]|nr:N-formylglutamate amidohydrolase [Spirochaetota bacterium]
MRHKLPILVIIPHGGRQIPDELSGYEQIDEFGIFIESDVYANELFNFDTAVFIVNSFISRLFIDCDRPPVMTSPYPEDGVIKQQSISGRKIFKDTIFPDEIAIKNILNRYYHSFHQRIEKIISDEQIKLILECHTMMPVGPRFASDSGRPRPLINIENINKNGSGKQKTCSDELADFLLSSFKKYFNNEEFTVSEKFSLNKPAFSGYIMEQYGKLKIPMLRLSVSSSLYLNDKYFNYDYLTVDNNRIVELRNKILAGIEKYSAKYFQ